MEDQFKQLAEIIRKKSQQNLLTWSPSNYVNTYQTSLGIGEILITYNGDDEYSPDGDKLPIFDLSFINERGETFHSILAYDTSDSDYNLLNDIYVSAHNSYMKTDETLKSMFDDILLK